MSKWGYKKVIETSKVCGANGECISDNLSDFRCSCHPGFTGEYCEISKEKIVHGKLFMNFYSLAGNWDFSKFLRLSILALDGILEC